MQIKTALALDTRPGALTADVSYLVETGTWRAPQGADVDSEGELAMTGELDAALVAAERPMTWQPGARWTDAAEAHADALKALRAIVSDLRDDTADDPMMAAALRVDEATLTVSWVAGEPGDETLVWRRSWRVTTDTTPRTVRPV